MERRDVEVFLTLAEELHFGRTARRLRVSQARVSQSVKAMERRIGAPLFDRTSRRVALTPIGRRLESDIRPAFEQLLAGIERAITAGRGIEGTLRLSFEAPALAELIALPLKAFRARYPACEIEIREAPFADPFAPLRSGEADVAVMLLPVTEDGLTTGPVVHTEPMVLAVAAGHPFARREFVTLEDLARDVVLRAAHPPPAYWSETTPEGKPITRGRAYGTFQELLLVIGAGEGICPLAAHAEQYFARPGIAFVPFRDAPEAHWGLVWPTAGETGRVRAFATEFQST
ncbi:LysR family transcriptional regulator [Allokutzneria albata]|uniref:DNA-binding transcriptional regulator, LysR family n=1 Tax=Allokutzneria albata TaxID=211114 RepID=A0A1G9U651_ALLAB|nr:LysR family transcriptional regulator [Allokutzneria albata]SDM55293.1 DNA-binding transcriptional regulator, LysR family [Allokutzneria albata]